MGGPLLGYNTNVRHAGKLFHIQTEDSGSNHGHIFTHLFADGGRIIASKKTTYTQYIGTARYPEAVKQLMRESHKAMFIALRDGLFDEDEAAGAKAMSEMEISLEADEGPATPSAGTPTPVDLEALDRAAEAKLAEAQAASAPAPATATASSGDSGGSGRYAATRPAGAAASVSGSAPRPVSRPASRRPDPASESIFGGDLLSEKSLDEVILSYLAEDVDEEG